MSDFSQIAGRICPKTLKIFTETGFGFS